MAINKDNSLKALHCCYTAGTGGGKSVAVQYANMTPEKPCLAIFDPYGDYEFRRGDPKNRGFAGKNVHHFNTRAKFAKNFVKAWRSGLPFRVAYMPKEPNRDEMLWFCELMWQACDGNRRLDAVIEELARWTNSIAKDNSRLGECLTGGRKFGLVMHTVFQRSTEVSKTILSQSPFKIIGIQESRSDAERMGKECDLTLADIKSLEPLTYFKATGGLGNVETLDLRHVFQKGGKEKNKPIAKTAK